MTSEDIREMLEAATPGPWDLDGIAIANLDAYPKDVCLMGEPLQYPGDLGKMFDNHEANARLIAAAPDLAAEVLRLREQAAFRDEADALRAEVERLKAETAQAVMSEAIRMKEWCAKRQAVSSKAWERAARKALAGDMTELRNRIAMIDAGPMDIVQSDAALGDSHER
jgi:hypothetical protein